MIIGPPSSQPDRTPRVYRESIAIPAQRARASSAPGVGGGPLPIKDAKVELPRGTASLKLKNHQKAYLSQLAEEAYNVARAHYSHDDLKLDAWRQRESINACGLRISEAEQRHYNDIKAHFELLKGDSGRAFQTQMREAGSDLRIADHKLSQELKKHGLTREYAEAIAIRKFKGQPLSHLTAKKLWVIIFDIRRAFTKAAQAKRAAKQATPPKPIADSEGDPY